MISLSKARFCDFSHRGYGNGFFEIGWWNYVTTASKPHIPFLWGIFLRLDSSSSCGEGIFVFTSKSAIYTAFELLFLWSERKWRPPRKIWQKNYNVPCFHDSLAVLIGSETSGEEKTAKFLRKLKVSTLGKFIVKVQFLSHYFSASLYTMARPVLLLNVV